jgi:AcrR family transcriptional regulator
MTSLTSPGDAYERILISADRLFLERGYVAVSLRDIAQEIGIRHASLYYHFPRGKEELYMMVMERRMRLFHAGLEQAIIKAGNDWQQQLRAAALWLLDQPALHLGRMMQSDMPAISQATAEQLRVIIFDALLKPIEAIFRQAEGIRPEKQGQGASIAGMFLSLIEGVYNLPQHYVRGSKLELVDDVLDVLVNGLKA